MLKKHHAENLIRFAEDKFLKNNIQNQKKLKRTWLQSMYLKSYSEIELKNEVVYSGEEFLDDLPETGVMFVANSESPAMDAVLLYRSLMLSQGHTFVSPKVNIGSLIPKSAFDKLLPPRAVTYLDCVPHPRDTAVSDFASLKACVRALKDGWLLTSPTPVGLDTTTSVHPSTAPFIKRVQPIVVPVRISGTLEAFGDGLSSLHNEEKTIRVTFKKPLKIDFSEHPEVISAQISCAIRSGE